MLHRWRGRRRSKLLSAVFAVAAIVALGVAVGIAKADPSENAGYRVPICHNGQTIVVDHAAVPALLARGDTPGECP
jgi:hypothetical protein